MNWSSESQLFNATARDLMTTDVEHVDSEELVGPVLDWLERNKYTGAPVYENDIPIGYIDQEAVRGETGPVSTLVKPLTLDRLLSEGTTFFDLLDALNDHEFYLLGGANELTGIVTRSDINKKPAYIHLYERISHAEVMLRARIEALDEDWQSIISPGRLGRIQDVKERQSGLELPLIQYAQFSDVLAVVLDSGIWEDFEFMERDRAERRFEELNSLRSDVAHSKPILHQEQIGSDSEQRDIADLKRGYVTLMTMLETLNATLPGSMSILGEFQSAGRELRRLYLRRCQICGYAWQRRDRGGRPESIHIWPLAAGGENELENMLHLCKRHASMFKNGRFTIDPETLEVESTTDAISPGKQLEIDTDHNIDRDFLTRWNDHWVEVRQGNGE